MFRAAIQHRWLVPALFAAVVCFSHIHQGSIAVDAIRYSAIASNILQTGDWINLYDRFTDSLYANKPPLLFWSLAGVFQTFGFSTFAAKFPAVLFTFILLLLVWHTARKLAGEAAGLWALLLLSVNRSFFRDLVELGFDGMAVCGAAFCLLAAVDFLENKTPRQHVWLLFSAGFLLILQSKPPYAAIAVFPVFVAVIYSGRLAEVLRDKGFWIALLLPCVVSGAWFAASGGQYLAAAVDNQLAEPLRQSQSFTENMVRWLKGLVVDFAPVSLLGIYFAWTILRRERREEGRVSAVNFMYLVLLLIAIPIILLIAQRSRYLWVPMLAAVHFSAIGLSQRLRSVSVPAIKQMLLALAFIVVLLVLFGVRVHRQNALAEIVADVPSAERQDLCFCVDGNMAHRHKRMAKYSQLLLELEFGISARVFNASELAGAEGQGCIFAVESNCLRGLEQLNIPHKVVRQVRGAALVEMP